MSNDDAGILAAGKALVRRISKAICNERATPPAAQRTSQSAQVVFSRCLTPWCRLVLVLVGCTLLTQAADWPRLGGPEGDGISPETGLLRTWPPAGPRELWKLSLGEGFGGAAIRDRQVYLLDRNGNLQDILRCLDLETGRELWQLAFDAPGNLPYHGSRNVPTVDADLLFVTSPFGGLHCVDRRTHLAVWSHHLVNDFKDPAIDRAEPPAGRPDKLKRAQLPTWGLTQAPLLFGDTVIVAPQTQGTGLVAYEKRSGKIRWTTGYLGRNWYSHVSPALMTLGGVPQVVMLAQPSDPEKSPAKAPPALITGVDARTGAILWRTNTPVPYKIPIAQPIALDDRRVFITGGYGLGCVTLEVTRAGGIWQPRIVRQSLAAATHIHAPIRLGDQLFVPGFRQHGSTNTGLVCLDLESRLRWQTGPDLEFDFGPFLVADGLLLSLNGKTGELYLIEPGATGFKVLAHARVLSAANGMAWAPMAFAEGRLLLRDQQEMKCLQLAGPGR